MSKRLIRALLCLLMLVMAVFITNESQAATFPNITEKYFETYIVPFGRKQGITLENGETIVSNNENICKIDSDGNMRILGTGKFTLTSKKGEEEKQLDFFAWNVCLKKDGYTVFSDVNKTKSAGEVYGKAYFAVSKTSVEKSFKIEDYLFTTGRYTESNLNGKYISSHYNETSDSSDVNNFIYALDNKFEEDDSGSSETSDGQSDGTYDATIKLGSLYKPNAESNLTWIVENEDILQLEDAETGKVRGIRVGTTILTGKSGNTKKIELKIKVYRDQGQVINVNRIILDQTEVKLKKKETVKLNATVDPSYADNRKISWVSSNPTVATVSIRGRVTPKSDGTVTITASTSNGASASCSIIIKSSPYLDIGDGADINLDRKTQKEQNAKLLWQFFIYYGFTENAAAGILGNLDRESNILPWNNAGKDSDKEYVKKVDSGAIGKSGFIHTKHHSGSGNEGFGLPQWTSDTKKQKLYEYLKEQNKYSIASLQGQAEFLLQSFDWESISLEHLKKSSAHSWQASYLKGYASLTELYKHTDSYSDAAKAMGCVYCRSGAINKPSTRSGALAKRVEKAKIWYEKFKGTYTP